MTAMLRARIGAPIGLGGLLGGMALHQSDPANVILAGWSAAYLGILIVIGLVSALALGRTVRLLRRPSAAPDPGPAQVAADVGMCALGLGYLIASLADPANAGRVLDLRPFASTNPVSAFAEWLALASFVTAAGFFAARRLSGRAADIALSVGTIIGLAVLGEGLVRLRTFIAPATQSFVGYSSEIWRNRHVRLDPTGFRDAPVASDRKPGARRMLVVGDSYAFGWGLPRTEDRFGERLADHLSASTGETWEPVNRSRPDSHTLHAMDFLAAGAQVRPDVVVLLYVFNDMDYLRPITDRTIVSETPRRLADRVHPVRLLYRNSFLFQEAYQRVRIARASVQAAPVTDPYSDSAVVEQHLGDLARFVERAASTGAVATIVPVDIAVAASPAFRRRHDEFVARARSRGLPMLSVADAYAGIEFSKLAVNSLDSHPNELAHRLAAEAAGEQLLSVLRSERPVAAPRLARF